MYKVLASPIWLFVFVLLCKSCVVGNVVEPGNDYPRSFNGEGPTTNISTLRLVQAVFRHGDRSQIRAYKNDIHKESDWPQGYGQLTTTGMQQEYELGQYLKKKYADTGFMKAAYTREELSVRSTNYDRTLMSAYSVLAGLFPPTDDQVWNKELPWQPIPVHTVPKEEDWLLHTDVDCPKYNEFTKKYSPFIELKNKTVRENLDLYRYMSQNTGEEPTWEGMGNVLDPLFCQSSNNMSLPAWVKANNTFEKLMNLQTDVYSSASFPPPVAYLKGGLLVGEMIEHMINKTVSPESHDKMYLYSAHDSTVVAHLTTLGLFNNKKPQYTACVITELHETKGDYYVRIMYKNDPYHDRQPDLLKLKNCDSLCRLDRFHQIMKSSIPSNIRKECGLDSISPLAITSKELVLITFTLIIVSVTSRQRQATVAIATLSSLILLMLVVGVILCCMMKKNIRDTTEYSPIPLEMS